MTQKDPKWLQMTLYVSNKSTKVIWDHLESWGNKISYIINLQCLLSLFWHGFIKNLNLCEVVNCARYFWFIAFACFSPVFEHFICQSSTNISLTFKDFLLTTFHLFNELVTTDIYPDEWATMRIIANEILLKTLQVLITYILLLSFC